MQTWMKLPRSMRYTDNGLTADVWLVSYGDKRMAHYTILDQVTDCYVSCGSCATIEEACAVCLKSMKVDSGTN